MFYHLANKQGCVFYLPNKQGCVFYREQAGMRVLPTPYSLLPQFRFPQHEGISPV
ncbi:MAG: hypothetical protein ACPGWR_29160 [Ardenticatenaceae bacterium]